jgi:hypothetical protein
LVIGSGKVAITPSGAGLWPGATHPIRRLVKAVIRLIEKRIKVSLFSFLVPVSHGKDSGAK